MIITISGRQGAGKTTIAKELAETQNYKFLSVGDLQGEIAINRGLTINELMELGKKEKRIHLEMDKKIIEIGKTRDNIVLEGWLAFHFIPHSYKIFLDVKKNVGAKRIFRDKREDEPKAKTLEEIKERLKIRLTDTHQSFKKYYSIDFLDPSHYDFILDTTNLTTQQVINKISLKIKDKNENHSEKANT